MTHVPYLVAGYGITFGVLGAYAAWIVRRGRKVDRELGPRLGRKVGDHEERGGRAR